MEYTRYFCHGRHAFNSTFPPWSGLLGTYGYVSASTATAKGSITNLNAAEEIKDSSRNLPMALMIGFGINALWGFLAVITICFTVVGVDDILASPTGYPFLAYFYGATKSYAGTTVMASIMVINLTASSIAVLATASRQMWSFARNKGLPFSSWLAPVS